MEKRTRMEQNNQNPLVSVSVITYNRKNLLPKALDSLLNQTYTNLEILVADNHSEDGTEELMREYVQKDSRIKYFRHEQNIGIVGNSNFNYGQASGKYFIPSCDDDWLDLDYVEKCVEFMEKNPEYELASPIVKTYDEDYNLLIQKTPSDLKQEHYKERVQSHIIHNVWSDVVSGMMRKSTLDKLYEVEGKYFSKRYGEDVILILKLIAAGKCKIIKNTFYNKMENGGTRSLKSEKESNYWKGSEVNEKNYFAILLNNFSEAVLQDKFFNLYISEDEKIKAVEALGEGIAKVLYYGVKSVAPELFKYIYRHPNFIAREDFYKHWDFLILRYKQYLELKPRLKYNKSWLRKFVGYVAPKFKELITYVYQHFFFMYRRRFYHLVRMLFLCPHCIVKIKYGNH